MKQLESVQKFLKSEKGGWVLLAAGMVGILLIFLSGSREESARNAPSSVVEVQTVSAEEYANRLEEKLRVVVQNIAGAGECSVMVTVEQGVEYVYAQDIKSRSERTEVGGEAEKKTEQSEQESSYLVGNGGALLISEKQPVVKGAVIVCKGAADPAVQQRVIAAVTTVLGVSSAKVCVTQMA